MWFATIIGLSLSLSLWPRVALAAFLEEKLTRVSFGGGKADMGDSTIMWLSESTINLS